MAKKNVEVKNESPVIEVTKENVIKLINNIIDNYVHTKRDNENYIDINYDYHGRVYQSVYQNLSHSKTYIKHSELSDNILDTYKEKLIANGYVSKYNEKVLFLLYKFNISFKNEPSMLFKLTYGEISGTYNFTRRNPILPIPLFNITQKIDYTFDFHKEPFDFTLEYGQYSFIFSYQEVLGFYEKYCNRLTELTNAKLDAEIQQRFTKYNVQ